MANDLAKLAARIANLERRLTQQTRTSQLAYSSIEDGAVAVYDAGGSLRAVIGQQPDGTSGVIAVNGPRPPVPSAPQVEPVLNGLRITWDGAFADADAAPLDLSRVQVHLMTSADAEPDVMWPAATIEAASGASVTIATNYYNPLWVRLVAVNTSGTPSLASTAVQTAARRAGAADVGNGAIQQGHIAVGAITTPHLAVGSVTPDQIAVGQGTNLIPDPGFEGAVTAAAVAAAGAPWSLARGNRTGVGIRVDCLADTPTYYTLPLATVPVLAGTQLYLAVDILTSDDLDASGVKILARWQNAAGTVLGYGVVEKTGATPGMWQRITGQVAAPQGTTQAVLALEASAATKGWAVFDNSEAHTIFGRVVGGTRAEVGPDGLRLYDENGDTAVALVTGAPQYLTLRSGGQAVATIDTSGNAGFADLAVAGELTIGGDPVTALLGQQARGIVAIDYQTTSVRTTGSEYGFVELAFEADATRMYRVVFDAIANPSTAGGEIQLRLRDGRANAPTVTSTQLQLATHHMAIGNSKRVGLELVRSGSFLGEGLHRLLITFKNQYGPDGQYVDLYGASNSPGVLYVEDIGAYVPETGRYNAGGGTNEPPVRTYTKTYNAAWSGSYANRSGYNSYYGNSCLQGYYSSNNGIQASLIGFPAALTTDLAGAVIRKAEIYLYFEHWYNASGGTAVIRAHSHASRPAKFSSDSESKSVTWQRNQGKWVDITSVFDSTKWRGIALDPGNTTNRTYYGRARGVGQTYPPKLRVTYTK
ncbi:hypothetical protein [Streptomyces ipomoeae]|uniref:hypothetical protein n=1 Tax=Streptomyces ipomoeae TaxID=103232 RepID=UPI0011465630|nr:hypothetical protein [Streptomyces ipomoeae]TQE33073.1 hypothetical protein Sipo7851_21460 [Streptomyces ipomoeae]